jgi:DNA modification methylase
MIIEKIPLDKLNPAPYHPRKDLQPGDPEYEKLKKSILTFGCVQIIVWNKRTGNVVGGHQTLKILKDLQRTEADVCVVDLDDHSEKALNIALNKISGEWDMEKLSSVLQELESDIDFDAALSGFDSEELENVLISMQSDNVATDDEFDEEIDQSETPFTQNGDIWLLDKHRVMCGDSTKTEDVGVLMNGQQADLCVTDPPYNVAYEGKSAPQKTIQNDNMSEDEFYKFLLSAHKRMYENMKDGAALYVFHADGEGLNFRKAFTEAGFKLAQCCIWEKNSMVLGRQDYQWQHEPVLYGWKPTGSHQWYSDRCQTTVWHFDRPLRSEDHPTMKPIPLVAYPIQNSSKKGNLVLDLFGGSGSTLMACEQAERICFTMEIDPLFCDVIVRRYIKGFNNSKIQLLRNGVKIDFESVSKEFRI